MILILVENINPPTAFLVFIWFKESQKKYYNKAAQAL
jgi:hypothetical protein